MQNKLYIFSGVPASKEKDEAVIKNFLSLEGKKAICGSTSLKIFCRITGKTAKLKRESFIPGNAPEYEVDGLDFASEGVLTLNAFFGDLKNEVPPSAAKNLSKLALEADEIIFITGGAENKLCGEDFFKSANVLPRDAIIDKIILSLRRAGKTVKKEKV
ncbi:MAG: hypothetical protein LBO62_01975 [Endomicrobium sp.]|jgi:hypothetical protein|nr:hypothetical protein [Endomicrobium sp.]